MMAKFTISKSVDNVLSSLGLAGDYRAFVKIFASLTSPLTCLLKKNVPFCWYEVKNSPLTLLIEQ